MRTLLVIFTLVWAMAANAALVTLTLSEDKEDKINNIQLSTGGVVQVDGADVNLTTVGAGLRKKYVLILGTDVYVAQLLVSHPEQYNKSNTGNDALLSLAANTVVAMRLDFVYNVPADKLYNAFVDALGANSVDLNAPEIAAFLTAVKDGGTASVGQSITFLTVKNSDGTESVTYENPSGVTTKIDGGVGFGQNVLSMWLGNILSNDKGLQELKTALLK